MLNAFLLAPPTGLASSGPTVSAAGGTLVMVLVIGVGVGIWFAVRKRGGRAGEPACGKCGYLVKGLTTFVCPECGSDLREVGIVGNVGTKPQAPRWPLLCACVVPVAVWFAAVVVFVMVASKPIHEYLWPYRAFTESLIQGVPQSARFTWAKFSTRADATAIGVDRAGRMERQQSRTGRIEILYANRPYALEIDYLADNHSFSDQRGKRLVLPGRPTKESVIEFLAGAGVDTSGDAIHSEAAAAASLMEVSSPYLHLQPPAQFPFTITSSGSHSPIISEAADFLDMQNAAGTVLLVGGTAIIVLRRRKRLRRSTPAAAPSPASTHPPLSAPARTLSILFSDIKDFTTRTAAGTRNAAIELVRRHRDLVGPIVKSHHGRVVKSIGDALLATFDSATDAVLSAMLVQARLRENNAAAFREDERFELRIAVSTGEVVVEESDVFGETVNVASRVQQLATAGEVLFTETTLAMVNKREVGFEEAGVFELKGMPGAVRVYRAVAVGQDTAAAQAERR